MTGRLKDLATKGIQEREKVTEELWEKHTKDEDSSQTWSDTFLDAPEGNKKNKFYIINPFRLKLNCIVCETH